MELLRSIIPLLEEFSNECVDSVVRKLNDKEKQAIDIILKSKNLSTYELNAKLAREIYNVGYTSSTYRSFKKTLEKKVIKIVSIVESKGSDIQKIRFRIHQSYTAMYHMLMLGVRKPAIVLGKKALIQAVKYHDYTTARNICKLLVRHYGTFGSKKTHQKYKDKYTQITSIVDLEYECELKYSRLVHEMKRNNISPKTRENTENWINSVTSQLELESAGFYHYYYQIKVKLCSDHEYENVCHEAIDYFENLYFNHSAFISIFKNKILQYKLKKGEVTIDVIRTNQYLLDNVEKFGTSWYLYARSLMKIYLNIGDYLEASKCLLKVQGSRKYRNIPKSHRNEWELLGMYKHIMAGEYDEVNIRKIKYNLNYNKTQKSSKNIPFLIGELIYLLKIGEKDLDKKINHLRNTIQNQCKGNELKRGLGFCDAVQKGQRFKVKKSKTSFENEYVFYEKLLEKV